MDRVAVRTLFLVVVVTYVCVSPALAQTPQAARTKTAEQVEKDKEKNSQKVMIAATRKPGDPGEKGLVIKIPINQVGVFDADYLNPRNPANVLHPERKGLASTTYREVVKQLNRRHVKGQPPFKDAEMDIPAIIDDAMRLSIAFDNRTITHALIVSFTVPDAQSSKDAAANAGAFVGPCKEKKCPARIRIGAKTAPPIPLKAFIVLDSDTEGLKKRLTDLVKDPSGRQEPLTFTVAFEDETAEPAQPKGYFSVVPLEYLGEPGTPTSWSSVISVSGAVEPDTGGDSKVFSSTEVYNEERDRRFGGAAELRLKQFLGARADADISIGYKDNSLGEKDQKGTLTATKYRVNVYALTGVTLSFGKFTFASPTSGVALRAKGEGFRLAYRNIAVSHLVVRESADGDANHDNRDNRQILLEANNFTLPRSGVFRSFNGVLLSGSEHLDKAAADGKPAVFPHSYLTVGGEAFFAFDQGFAWQGSLAGYRSRAEAMDNTSYKPASGGLVLATVSMSDVERSAPNEAKKARVNFTITAQAGLGSRAHGDDLTTGENHAYTGEQSAFAPDTLLLSRFGKRIRLDGWQPSLGNKEYWSLGYSDQRFSLLRLPTLLWIPSSDIASQSTSVQWHHITLREGQAASADEFALKWTIETPAGIESSLTASRVWVRGALATVLRRNPWALVANLKVTLQ